MATANQTAEWQRRFSDFLEQDHGRGLYMDRVNAMCAAEGERLIITIDDLRSFDKDLFNGVLNSPSDFIPAAERALLDTVRDHNNSYLKIHPELFIGFDGNFGSRHVSPRGLSAALLGQFVCLEGIITKCYEVRAKVIRSVHYAPATGKSMEQVYSDAATISGKRTTVVYPKTDNDGNILITEFGLSRYHDNQMITMQEMPERAPAGQIPRSVDIILFNDLCDTVKPGDRVRVMGIYRAFPSRNQGSTSGVFRTALLSTYVERILKAGLDMHITPTDIREMKSLAKQHPGTSIFTYLSRSISPSVYGHDWVKKAVLCMMLGGGEKNLENGAHLRGDINVLLVGDPSTAKSQMLRYVLNSAPLAVATTGRGSSGVGLTAAVLTDRDTGEKRLEAGAMVLADRGVVCIDEFDKMSELDRVAIHEVMEQQTVTINKAAIHTTLNARCSVLAAANPIYGKYQEELTTMENVHLPDSLLSRFDLLFIILDSIDPAQDRRVSQHVLSNHTYRAPNEPDGFVKPSFVMGSDSCMAGIIEEEEKEVDDGTIYEKPIGRNQSGFGRQKNLFLKQRFLRKYIQWAKFKFTPKLSSEVSEYIAQEYVAMRSSRALKTQPITARTLETMIRLSTSIAKCRLSKDVLKMDAIEALKIMKFALLAEEPEPEADESLLTFNRATNKLKRLDEDEDSSYIPQSTTISQESDTPAAKRTRHTETDESLLSGLPDPKRKRPQPASQSMDSAEVTLDDSTLQSMDTDSTVHPVQDSNDDDLVAHDIQPTIDVADPPHMLSFAQYSKFSADLGRWLQAQPSQRSSRTEAVKAMADQGWTVAQAEQGLNKLISAATHLMEEGGEIFFMG